MLTAFGLSCGSLNGSSKPLAQHRIDTGLDQRSLHASPCGSSQIGASNAAGKRGGERGKIGTLIASTEDQAHIAIRKRRQRLDRGINIRCLGVVPELDFSDAAAVLESVRDGHKVVYSRSNTLERDADSLHERGCHSHVFTIVVAQQKPVGKPVCLSIGSVDAHNLAVTR